MTAPTPTLAVVTVGGAPVGMSASYSDTLVCCPECGESYPMAIRPCGFVLTPVGIIVGAGYVEKCPMCPAVLPAGSVLGYGGMR